MYQSNRVITHNIVCITDDIASLRGPPGRDGRDGRDGKDCELSDIESMLSLSSRIRPTTTESSVEESQASGIDEGQYERNNKAVDKDYLFCSTNIELTTYCIDFNPLHFVYICVRKYTETLQSYY